MQVSMIKISYPFYCTGHVWLHAHPSTLQHGTLLPRCCSLTISKFIRMRLFVLERAQLRHLTSTFNRERPCLHVYFFSFMRQYHGYPSCYALNHITNIRLPTKKAKLSEKYYSYRGPTNLSSIVESLIGRTRWTVGSAGHAFNRYARMMVEPSCSKQIRTACLQCFSVS